MQVCLHTDVPYVLYLFLCICMYLFSCSSIGGRGGGGLYVLIRQQNDPKKWKYQLKYMSTVLCTCQYFQIKKDIKKINTCEKKLLLIILQRFIDERVRAQWEVQIMCVCGGGGRGRE